MAQFVIKNDGTKEPFDSEKIKRVIGFAAKEASLPEEQINEVAEKVSNAVLQLAEGKEEIPTAEIKEKILSELDAVAPSVSEAWRKYDQEKAKA